MLSEAHRQSIERALTWVLTIALFAALIGVVYVAVTPQPTGDAYTEFYVLGPEGSASGYPTNLTVEERGEFILGITNNENREIEYTIVLVTNQSTVAERTVTVDNGERWEGQFSFTPESAGLKELNILLYKGDSANLSSDPYRRLRLVIEVRLNDTNG